MNNKILFVRHIADMETGQLESVLVKNIFKKFSNVSFIEKLDELFTEFKDKGNTSIEVHKGEGVCDCNKDMKVFCFVANNTRDYFTLSYLEDKNNYYYFTKSCEDVSYDTPLHLSTFHYFSIKAEETSEYKNLKQTSNSIREYEALRAQDVCNINNVELWLAKYKDNYKAASALINDDTSRLSHNPVELLVKKEFESLYGKLNLLSILYKKEAYFKKQLVDYIEVNDSVSKLNKWFQYQEENKSEYELFSTVFNYIFNDIRAHTHFKLELDDLVLNREDFKYTLEYLSIIEDNKAIVFEGKIKTIGDLKVYKTQNSTSDYSKCTIVLSPKDDYYSDYYITFSDESIIHLEGIEEGQFVKVLASITTGEWKNQEGALRSSHFLTGWRLERIEEKVKVHKTLKEMKLYHKYIAFYPPF